MLRVLHYYLRAIMSTTATTTTSRAASAAPATLSILADYELRHTGSDESDEPPAAVDTSQPANWPSDHRRVPAYRPINRDLDFNERSAGASTGEFVFIQVMLHGVWLNGVSKTVCHSCVLVS